MSNEAFFHVYSGLPRQGPGSETSTRKAIGLLPALPRRPRVLDAGSGTGAQTMVLARELQAQITAIDLYQPYLDELAQSAAEQEIEGRIETRRISMDALDYPPNSFDLIWSEGAIYSVGVSRALELWLPLLRPGGAIAFTELCWLSENRPVEAAAFWNAEYPGMTDVEGNCARALAEGFSVAGHFTLPAEDWWNYYTPLGERAARLRNDCEPGSDLVQVIEETEAEIELYRRFGKSYGYVFYLLLNS